MLGDVFLLNIFSLRTCVKCVMSVTHTDQVTKMHRFTLCLKTYFKARRENITKTCLYNFDSLKSHFYIHVVKLGIAGVYIIFLISAQKHRLWVLVRTASSRRF